MWFTNSVFPNCRAKHASRLQLQNIINAYNIQIRFFQIDQFFMTKLVSNGMKKCHSTSHQQFTLVPDLLRERPKAVIQATLSQQGKHVQQFQQTLTHFQNISNFANEKKFLCHKLSQHLQLFTFSTQPMCFNSREATVFLKVWINLQIKSPSSITAHSCT